MKYVLLFCDTEQSEKAWEAMDEAERGRAFEQVDRWFAKHAGKITHSARLQSPRSATTVRLESGSEPIVTDGPFVDGSVVSTNSTSSPQVTANSAWAANVSGERLWSIEEIPRLGDRTQHDA
jgi:hypothetical protein